MSERTITRDYANIGTEDAPRLIHYYRCGSGPVVLLLHPSPASGASFLPILQRLGERATAIALDTPGYGFSSDLDGPADDLTPYVAALESFRTALDVDDLVIYGSATGAQIALEYSKRHPEHCASIVLDNCGDFPDDVCAQMIDGYFPDLAIDYSGAHLTRIWTMALDLHRFFPWHWHGSEEARLPEKPVDDDVMQLVTLQYLQAGPDYDKAYRAAFANERIDRLLATQCRTTVLRSEGSALSRYAARFDNQEWPDHIQMLRCGKTPQERLQAIVDAVFECTEKLPVAAPAARAPKHGRRMVAHAHGSINAVFYGDGQAQWLLLHDIGSHVHDLDAVVAAFAAEARVLAPDLPGHGASDALGVDGLNYLDMCDDVIRSVLDESQLDRTQLLAFGESAAVAMHIAAKLPTRVSRIVLVDPLSGSDRLSMAPAKDGTHLLSAWHYIRNAELYYQPDRWTADNRLAGPPDLAAEHVNRRLIARLLCDGVYTNARDAVDGFPTREAVIECELPVTIARTASASGDRARRNFPDIDGLETVELPREPTRWRTLLRN